MLIILHSVVHPMWIRTAMFDSALKKKAFTDTLLQPNDVADAITRQVLGGKSGQVFLPGYYSFGSGFRGLPTWVQERFRDARAHLFSGN